MLEQGKENAAQPMPRPADFKGNHQSGKTILIANRGEIARRIIRSARALGIGTLAVYSDADAAAPHVREADHAVYVGPASPQLSYLNAERILDIATEYGVSGIHPGYGFLSENADFAREVESRGIAFIGPTPEQLEQFGTKHTARKLAQQAGVPMMQGSGLLDSAESAVAAAEGVGFPVMLKATGGGGGIGMQACYSDQDIRAAYESVQRLAQENFSAPGLFVERLIRPARHVEVQIFGDGLGGIAILGDRDCSLQRRNQKVVEEAPAPELPLKVRAQLHDAARRLGQLVHYRSAGTIEFVYDPVRGEASFLEVNARLQVEHPVTEQVYGVDLVELMLRLALDGPGSVRDHVYRDYAPAGHAIEARVYAEDPNHASRPSPGLVTGVSFPAGDHIRVDSWIETGLEITAHYDPLVAKIIVTSADREQAVEALGQALDQVHIYGVVTNVGLLQTIALREDFRASKHSTTTLADARDTSARIDVLSGGTLTTVQDTPGRLGYWNIGIPPSGPMDALSHALANRAVGNPGSAPTLECTMTGPRLRFSMDALVAITGAQVSPTVDNAPVPMWEPIAIKAGQTLDVGQVHGPGLRNYVAVRGGFDEPLYLGSAATFILGKFGGHAGRKLLASDVLTVKRDRGLGEPGVIPEAGVIPEPGVIPEEERPIITRKWELSMLEGPQGAPEYLTEEDMEVFFSQPYTVHFNVDRTGVRLTGPKPQWSRNDGGEAGLHPSNVHDNAYVVGAVDFSGDTPILLGPDGPSLGGFICPAVLTPQDMWKLGQLRPGDTVYFKPVVPDTPIRPGRSQDRGIIAHIPASASSPSVTYRRAGMDNILVEYGEPVLDIGLRMRVWALEQQLNTLALTGIKERTPAIRSLLVGFDSKRWDASQLVDRLLSCEEAIGATDGIVVPSRRLELPLVWDDDSVAQAIERYRSTVREEAPWLPWNIEFIRRINGLSQVDDVYNTVFAAEYLVMGLGDVYLGAPVATPLDPRHRLVTTKYNPARTFTPENAVGLGGSYLCVYGLEGPGGYQLIGRTVPIFSRYRTSGMFAEHPWALDFFDRISWYPVSAAEMVELRREVAAGRWRFPMREGEFSYAEYQGFLQENQAAIAEFRTRQQQAFEVEKAQWLASGEFDPREDTAVPATMGEVAAGDEAVVAPIMGGVWKILAAKGDAVSRGQALVVLEAMKMETIVEAPVAGRVSKISVSPGTSVTAGQVIATITPDDPHGLEG